MRCAFRTLLCSLLFDCIPTLHPHVHIRDGGPWDPQMHQWGEPLHRGGGGVVGNVFRPKLFHHWEKLPMMIEEYPYSGMNYHADIKLSLPVGHAWGHDGKA
jgi:hypothetical protein